MKKSPKFVLIVRIISIKAINLEQSSSYLIEIAKLKETIRNQSLVLSEKEIKWKNEKQLLLKILNDDRKIGTDEVPFSDG